ncbi:P-loop containing nucleoside triphosphate hydrolase protein [Sistotremastrum niveocremeum HHB9708]|uniref:Guanine nucleotide-binding protein-like 1 n=1 Tax=Sistotremastrum niveocremeum HHB9708 TaxID=1314777 RepID=A0A164SPY0_9AGAM|nr:P-loop containing nucleoside triphosphate hydrolase protein [Sistotremastrum niveocremeum HHB9708]
MPRRKPQSAKQHKAELQLKRAIKRGDIPPPSASEKPARPNNRKKAATPGYSRSAHSDNAAAHVKAELSSKRLASSFAKLSPEFLEKSRQLASNVPLPRPLPRQAAIFQDLPEDDLSASAELTCPKRPKWRFDMEKKEVERNEEAFFKKWLEQTDERVQAWVRAEDDENNENNEEDQEISLDTDIKLPRSQTYFERNIEVWRQLWRVTEISQILLILLDSRCPPLHYPPSLHAYLTSLRPARKIVLVLTKTDVVGEQRANAWAKWLRGKYPEVKVVQVESYRERVKGEGQGQRVSRDPHLPLDLRNDLFSTLRACHAEICEPPAAIRDNEEKLKTWKPRVRPDINWRAVGSPHDGPRPKDREPGRDKEESVPEFLTIGLIGQPNVGKSSLLNALFGTHKVKASRTPGKTKHFQTLFLNPQIRLVDCPGLVFPNTIGMEMQVLSAILPISQIPSIPSCIHHAARLLPLEEILNLQHPSALEPKAEDKRTWRDGQRPAETEKAARPQKWTTMDILTSYAILKGWVTAKAGRPDTNRAGNAILRLLAEAKIPWAFWPPDFSLREVDEGLGIWLGQVHPDESDDSSEGERDDDDDLFDSDNAYKDAHEDGSGEETTVESEEEKIIVAGGGKFGALTLVDDDDEEDEDSE